MKELPNESKLLRSAIQKKGVLGHFASFGPFSLLVDIKRQCPVVYLHNVSASWPFSSVMKTNRQEMTSTSHDVNDDDVK